MNSWQASYRLIRSQQGAYLLNSFLWGILSISMLLPGLITRAILDQLTGQTTVGWSIGTLLALLVGIGLARFGNLLLSFLTYVKFRHRTSAMLRLNMLGEILRHPGAAALPNSSGEAVSRFSGDVNELLRFTVDRLVDMWGMILLPIVGLTVLFWVNTPITLVIIVPLALVMVLVNLMRQRLEQSRDARRRAAAYEDAAALREAFAGAERLLFISGSEVGSRVPQHTNIIDAAGAAGVGLIACASRPGRPAPRPAPSPATAPWCGCNRAVRRRAHVCDG